MLPFLTSVFLLLWMVTWLFNAAKLISTGNITQPTAGSQMKVVELTDEQQYMLIGQVFMFFWVYEIIQAVFNYTLIVAVCTWYFTSNQDVRGTFSISTGFGWAIFYNFGSLTFGAFILAIIWIIRIMFEIIDQQMKNQSGDNAVVKCVMNCVRCCLDCFHRFVKFLNENAYI